MKKIKNSKYYEAGKEFIEKVLNNKEAVRLGKGLCKKCKRKLTRRMLLKRESKEKHFCEKCLKLVKKAGKLSF
jgi:hypothetical protein